LSKIDNNIHITPITIVYRDQAGLIDIGWYGDMELLPHFISVLKKTHKQRHLFVGDQNVDVNKDQKGFMSGNGARHTSDVVLTRASSVRLKGNWLPKYWIYRVFISATGIVTKTSVVRKS
jgi:hypothetical protein